MVATSPGFRPCGSVETASFLQARGWGRDEDLGVAGVFFVSGALFRGLSPLATLLGICLWVVTVVGCQPYIDHETNWREFQPEGQRYGPKRRLELLKVAGDGDSVIFTFNQPLRFLGSNDSPELFVPVLFPAIPIEGSEWEGVAGVRVRLARPLALATTYRVTVPAGWRAATGAALMYPAQRRLTTPLPSLQAVGVEGVEQRLGDEALLLPGSMPLELVFNQPVVLGSVKAALRLSRPALDGGKGAPLAFSLTQDQAADKRRLLLSSKELTEGRYLLHLGPGVKGLEGPLRSESVREVVIDIGQPTLLYQGETRLSASERVPLKFSAPVTVEELSRCLIVLPSEGFPRLTADRADPTLLWLHFENWQRPRYLRLVSGLEGARNSRLERDILIELLKAQREGKEASAHQGFWSTDQAYYAPNDSMRVLGASWQGQAEKTTETVPVKVQLLNEVGMVVARATTSWRRDDFVEIAFTSPSQPGRYRVVGDGDTTDWRTTEFRVTPVAQGKEKYRLELSSDGQRLAARLHREGERHRKLGLRARFVPKRAALPQVQGWTPITGWRPSWETLAETHKEEFDIALPGSEGGKVLVEAFDLSEPSLVVAKAEHPIASSHPELQLEMEPFDFRRRRQTARIQVSGGSEAAWTLSAVLSRRVPGSSDWVEIDAREHWDQDGWSLHLLEKGDYRLTVSAQNPEGERLEAVWEHESESLQRGGLFGGVTLSHWDLAVDKKLGLSLVQSELSRDWKGFLWGGKLPPGWSSLEKLAPWQRSLSLPELAGSYPLLEPQVKESFFSRWTSLQNWDRAVHGGSASGAYQWRLLARDRVGNWAWAWKEIEIAGSSWKLFAPWGVRDGDRFEAGATFVPGPAETSLVGLTAGALIEPENLLPLSYLSTASVTKKGAVQRLGFQYEWKPGEGKLPQMAWELGQGGTLRRESTVLEEFTVEPVARGEGVSSLASGSSKKLGLFDKSPWKLELLAPEEEGEVLLTLRGPRGSLRKVRLSQGSPPVSFQGVGPGTMEIIHQGGPSLSYEMSRFEPDRGGLSPWGSEVYLLRRMLDGSGAGSESSTVGELCEIESSFVSPISLPEAKFLVPLPGGMRPLDVAMPDSQGSALTWKVRPGAVEVSLSDLKPGEYRWRILAESVAAGDYLWPTSRAFSTTGELLALSGSRRWNIRPAP